MAHLEPVNPWGGAARPLPRQRRMDEAGRLFRPVVATAVGLFAACGLSISPHFLEAEKAHQKPEKDFALGFKQNWFDSQAAWRTWKKKWKNKTEEIGSSFLGPDAVGDSELELSLELVNHVEPHIADRLMDRLRAAEAARLVVEARGDVATCFGTTTWTKLGYIITIGRLLGPRGWLNLGKKELQLYCVSSFFGLDSLRINVEKLIQLPAATLVPALGRPYFNGITVPFCLRLVRPSVAVDVFDLLGCPGLSR